MKGKGCRQRKRCVLAAAYGRGLLASSRTRPAQAICDGFVYIAQHGRGTASLNVACAAAIVLHRFSEWAGYAEAPRDSEQPGKFAVAERPQRTAPRGVAGQDPEAVRAARQAARDAADDADGAGLAALADEEAC